MKLLVCVFVLDFGFADADLRGCDSIMRVKGEHRAPHSLWSSQFLFLAYIECCGGTPTSLLCWIIPFRSIDAFVFSWLVDFLIRFSTFNTTTVKQASRSIALERCLLCAAGQPSTNSRLMQLDIWSGCNDLFWNITVENDKFRQDFHFQALSLSQHSTVFWKEFSILGDCDLVMKSHLPVS